MVAIDVVEQVAQLAIRTLRPHALAGLRRQEAVVIAVILVIVAIIVVVVIAILGSLRVIARGELRGLGAVLAAHRGGEQQYPSKLDRVSHHAGTVSTAGARIQSWIDTPDL
jgi:hypothetical protein